MSVPEGPPAENPPGTASPRGAGSVVDDPAELRALYTRDLACHIYALADLAPMFWDHSTWWRDGEAAMGLVGLPGGHRVVYAVSSAAPDDTLALVVAHVDDLPEATLVTGPVGVADALVGSGRVLAWHRTYHRWVLDDRRALAGVDTSLGGSVDVVPLGPDDAEELEAFYALDPGAAFFLPSMLDDGTFVGVREGGSLVAAAGTHVVAHRERAAAIGSVMTAPAARGRGLAAVVTAGVVARLGDRVDVVGLNCSDRNVTAQRIYERLGFRRLLQYEEAEIAAPTTPAWPE